MTKQYILDEIRRTAAVSLIQKCLIYRGIGTNWQGLTWWVKSSIWLQR